VKEGGGGGWRGSVCLVLLCLGLCMFSEHER
jgi:hypothetical protein